MSKKTAKSDQVFINAVREVLGLDPLYGKHKKSSNSLGCFSPRTDLMPPSDIETHEPFSNGSIDSFENAAQPRVRRKPK